MGQRLTLNMQRHQYMFSQLLGLLAQFRNRSALPQLASARRTEGVDTGYHLAVATH
jgi:hypothetical protein